MMPRSTALLQDPAPGASSEPQAVLVPLRNLNAPRFSRARGLDPSHVAALAETHQSWPPIVVASRGWTVVDGQHRVAAARDLALTSLPAIFFDGTDEEAYTEFVRRNVSHGLPLPLAERRQAARRILADDATRSDRGVAELCGLSPKTVAKLRAEAETSSSSAAPPNRRRGRDGRLRPVDTASLRSQIEAEIERQPGAPLRRIAEAVGASPETVRSVQRTVREREQSPALAGAGAIVAGLRRSVVAPKLAADPAFGSRVESETFSKLFDATAVDRAALLTHIEAVPLSRIYDVADEARRRATYWQEFAEVLESRVRRRA